MGYDSESLPGDVPIARSAERLFMQKGVSVVEAADTPDLLS